MELISLKEIDFGFGGPKLLDGLNFNIKSGEKVCLMGRNGVGKSTLLKIISGKIKPDSGNIVIKPGTKVSYLAQNPPDNILGNIHTIITEGIGEIADLLNEYNRLDLAIRENPSPELFNKFEQIQQQIDLNQGWHITQKTDDIIKTIGLLPHNEYNKLSTGLKRKVLIAKALVGESDIILLDEPSNHLDIKAISWLEEHLSIYDKSICFITHDRTLIHKLASRIVELERGKLTNYTCTYKEYLKRKEEELSTEKKQVALFEKKLSIEEVWIRQGVRERRTRNMGRVKKLKEMRKEHQMRRERMGKTKIQLQQAHKSGKVVVETDSLSFSYDDNTIIKDFTTFIIRGDKIGIIGPNGAGKSTLLRLLLGKLEPASGKIKTGVNMEIAYFDQTREQLDDNKTVQENICGMDDTVVINGLQKHITSYLKDFLFLPAQARTSASALSGGEKNRLLLARLFLKPFNVLILDEPTNDLDLETLELLEEKLVEFNGTLFLVSHDRTFLNNIVTSTISFEGNGLILEYAGGYDDYLKQKQTSIQSSDQKKPETKKKKEKPKSKKTKLSYNEERELKSLPEKIEPLEEEQKKLHNLLNEPDFYKNQGQQLQNIQNRLKEIDSTLLELYERWEYLESI